MDGSDRPRFRIFLGVLVLLGISLACNIQGVNFNEDGDKTSCSSVGRGEYELASEELGQNPQVPEDPESAEYWVCRERGFGAYVSAEMLGGDKPTETGPTIPEGTYTGELNFYRTLEDDWDDSALEPVCSENTIRLVIGSDGAAQGEIRSICSSSQDTDNPEMQMTHHSDVTGVIQGELPDSVGELSVSYNWHSYFTSPQWETTSLDETVEFEVPYHVSVVDNRMVFTPAADVEDYYAFELTKE